MISRKYRVAVAVLALAAGLIGCSGTQAVTPDVALPAATAVSQTVDLGPEVSPDVVSQLNAQGDIVVIDVREPSEYADGHIAGATLIPLGTLPDNLSSVPTDQPVVLVCHSGNRSGQAYSYLTQQGFANVHNMTGGMIAWQAAGLNIEK